MLTRNCRRRQENVYRLRNSLPGIRPPDYAVSIDANFIQDQHPRIQTQVVVRPSSL